MNVICFWYHLVSFNRPANTAQGWTPLSLQCPFSISEDQILPSFYFEVGVLFCFLTKQLYHKQADHFLLKDLLDLKMKTTKLSFPLCIRVQVEQPVPASKGGWCITWCWKGLPSELLLIFMRLHILFLVSPQWAFLWEQGWGKHQRLDAAPAFQSTLSAVG